MILGITGASGRVGQLAVAAALEKLCARSVVATTRTPEALAAPAGDGVDIRYADFNDPQALPKAFAGIDRLVLISANDNTTSRVDQYRKAICAARDAGIGRIVFTSMTNADAPDHPAAAGATEYSQAEGLLRETGLPWTVLRIAPYAEMHVVDRFVPGLAGGEICTNAGAGRVAFVSRADAARAGIAAAISGGEDHVGRTYDITGPALHGYAEVAALLTEVSGCAIRCRVLDDASFGAHLAASGAPVGMAEGLTAVGRAVREGYFEVCTDDYRRMTGRDPLPLRQVLDAHREQITDAATAVSVW